MKLLTLVAGTLLASTHIFAIPPATRPACEGTSASLATTASVSAGDPAVLKILNAQELAGSKYETIRAELEYTVVDIGLGDSEKRAGWLAYRKADGRNSAMIRIHFEKLKQDEGPWIRQKEDYAFDGEWATVAKHATRQMELYQVAPPGEKVAALKLGKGPLPPLPFGQKAADVLEYFEVTTRPPAKTDPNNSVYLKLRARGRHREELDFRQLEIWFDKETFLPVKIVGRHRNRSIHTVELKSSKVNVKLEKNVFRMSRRGWKVIIRPYEKQ